MCHVIPVASSVVTTIMWHKTRNPKIGQLNTLFYGASVFGVVDHLWNGEFFMFSGDIVEDLALGVAISAAVLAVWGIGLLKDRIARGLAVTYKA